VRERILLLDHGRTFAGGQVMAARLLPALRARGFRIDALAGCPEVGGGPIPATYAGLRRAMRGYDLIYANTARTALAAATQSRPFLWHKHLPETTWLQRLMARRATRVISVVRFGAPRTPRLRIVHNGVPAMSAEPAKDLPPGPKILLLGRMEREKGHDTALEALDHMEREATLLCAGPGAWYLERRHPRAIFLGFRRDVAALLAACDVLLNASRFDEGAPLVVLEAQRAGVPVVATRVGGTPEVVLDGVTAFLVPREDPAAMARALDRALAVDRAAWRAQGRAHAERFGLEACADAVAEVVRECLEEGQGARGREPLAAGR
jgi:glycosyltransferase involved in cell wall biosynthesis